MLEITENTINIILMSLILVNTLAMIRLLLSKNVSFIPYYILASIIIVMFIGINISEKPSGKAIIDETKISTINNTNKFLEINGDITSGENIDTLIKNQNLIKNSNNLYTYYYYRVSSINNESKIIPSHQTEVIIDDNEQPRLVTKEKQYNTKFLGLFKIKFSKSDDDINHIIYVPE